MQREKPEGLGSHILEACSPPSSGHVSEQCIPGPLPRVPLRMSHCLPHLPCLRPWRRRAGSIPAAILSPFLRSPHRPAPHSPRRRHPGRPHRLCPPSPGEGRRALAGAHLPGLRGGHHGGHGRPLLHGRHPLRQGGRRCVHVSSFGAVLGPGRMQAESWQGMRCGQWAHVAVVLRAPFQRRAATSRQIRAIPLPPPLPPTQRPLRPEAAAFHHCHRVRAPGGDHHAAQPVPALCARALQASAWSGQGWVSPGPACTQGSHPLNACCLGSAVRPRLHSCVRICVSAPPPGSHQAPTLPH